MLRLKLIGIPYRPKEIQKYPNIKNILDTLDTLDPIIETPMVIQQEQEDHKDIQQGISKILMDIMTIGMTAMIDGLLTLKIRVNHQANHFILMN